MVETHAETLRKAIENLINAKLHDALARPGGLDRLTAHRVSGVASFDVRNAQRRLEQTLGEVLASGHPGAARAVGATRAALGAPRKLQAAGAA